MRTASILRRSRCRPRCSRSREDLLVPPSLSREFAARAADRANSSRSHRTTATTRFSRKRPSLALCFAASWRSNREPEHRDAGACRAGVDVDTAHGAIMPPLYLSTNYSFAGFAQKRALRLHAFGQSDARCARRGARRTRGRRRRAGHRVGHGGDHAADRAVASRRSDRRAARLLRRLLSPVQGAGRARVVSRGVRRFRQRHRARRRARAQAEDRLDRNAEQSAAAHHRHRARRASRARGRMRWSSSTTRFCRRRSSSRCRSAPTSSCIRRRNISTAIPMSSAAR